MPGERGDEGEDERKNRKEKTPECLGTRQAAGEEVIFTPKHIKW